MTTRVLVVDDSATMRAIMTRVLQSDPAIEVVGAVSNPFEAREAIKALQPDVLTLDIEMPRMDGLSFLEKVMRLRPMPVVMVSSLTQKGAEASVEALALGAVDCVAKPSFGQSPLEAFATLPSTVKAAARAAVGARTRDLHRPSGVEADYVPGSGIVCIGSSTGGVEALLTVLSTFPKNCPPTLIVQHMPETFTKSFAARLDTVCKPSVAEAHAGAPILPGHVWIAPGGVSHLEISGGDRLACRLTDAPAVNGHRPSVDVLFRSAVRLGAKALGVILTGMGRDGADGLLAMRGAGATTIGQNEATSLIYGMPKAAFEIGAVGAQHSLQSIGSHVLAHCRNPRRSS